jgi:molybdopterin-guanine dinucleotide biosynthesis protein A
MGVDHKALVELDGETLLQRVIRRLELHVEPLLLSCASEAGEFRTQGLAIVPDRLPRYRGPLVGLYSALRYLQESGRDTALLLCPCDAPFVPAGLVDRLVDAQQEEERPVVVAAYLGELQPTFSLWHTTHLPVLRDAVEVQGMGGLKQVLKLLPYKTVNWERAEPPPFFNVNSPGDLKAAHLWLEHDAAS